MCWAIANADRGRFWTLTQCPDNWQQAREWMKDFSRRIRKSYRCEMAWAIEENPKLTGWHIHAIQHGEYVPQRRLETLWGGRRVWLEELKRKPGDYFVKADFVAGYIAEGELTHLDMNGGRAIHMTRRFLHGWTSREVLKDMGTGKAWYIEAATIEERESIPHGRRQSDIDKPHRGDSMVDRS